ncbi:MAG: TetR/AcrR family transcriptional regulator [Calditrichaeota bacterium]|nr:MAG: TetR/AcrR family transcriptional regulator [Calditrichota bacterium]
MEKGKDTKQLILDAAVSMTSKIGLEALSIGKLAAETCMSKSGLFAHFNSKQNLQIAVLKAAEQKFINSVIRPALEKPRGIERIRAIFDNWLQWTNSNTLPGGCPFVSMSMELTSQPGRSQNYLKSTQTEWLNFLAGAARIAIEEKQFRKDLDQDQFAYEFFSIFLAYQHARHLLQDLRAELRARSALDRLLESVKF